MPLTIMDPKHTTSLAPPRTSSVIDDSDDLFAEADEPPDGKRSNLSALLVANDFTFGKANSRVFERRESLLTRQLHSEAEQTDEEPIENPPRAMSTQSTRSTASMADLTSDDGHSVPSPAISPPFPPTLLPAGLPATSKLPADEPRVVIVDDRVAPKVADNASEQTVEANLGRKRCISFACGGNKTVRPPTSQPREAEPAAPTAATTEAPPQRKCSLKFVCPTRNTVEAKANGRPTTPKRRGSPAPVERRQSSEAAPLPTKHRDSDSTLRHPSPKATRKSPSITTTSATPTTPKLVRKYSNDSNESNDASEAVRFHEFASSDDEPDEWCQESTAYRSRLTINDTLQKENIIRKACEEVEEEAVDDDADEEAQLDDDGEDDIDDENVEDDDDIVEEDDEDSDEGFRTDDEGGFAETDSEGEDSDADWWTPGGHAALSTAATSVEHMERVFSQISTDDLVGASSAGSPGSDHLTKHMSMRPPRRHNHHAVPIHREPDASDLPDSTDFVCGTLDEDRPMEQAFLDSMKQREAAKHKARPQDIDPTFPTSDPELDEEDDDDLVDPDESEDENDLMMHGELDEIDGEATLRRRASPRPGQRSTRRSRSPAPLKPKVTARSPKPPTRRNTKSPPPPTARAKSPAPPKRQNSMRAKSPAPPKRQNSIRAKSPAPPKRRNSIMRSPPPPVRRNAARSPAPTARKLFGPSPTRPRSPAPGVQIPSPANTRLTSPAAGVHFLAIPPGLAGRPPPITQASSLPRGGDNMLSRLQPFHAADDADDVDGEPETPHGAPKRGAIDIVKGLEKKRQRRKEKLYQKACAKAAAKGEKAYKVKPGKGAERMREVGLELQRYRGKGEHIISM